MAENKKFLVAGFHIAWATHHGINKDTNYFRFSYKFVVSKGLLFFASTKTFLFLVLLLSS